ncbi:hypothetical protein SERN_1348 [Serinibacter arcticus]|uniref:Uncharacterized protein n=1 Tax=Serinibacter arcticus TaxID=1655435 RepID=A0A4Z1E0E7_9MICO|nr:hypothetical protein SERN_1348 [Serinibacter arcticus]
MGRARRDGGARRAHRGGRSGRAKLPVADDGDAEGDHGDREGDDPDHQCCSGCHLSTVVAPQVRSGPGLVRGRDGDGDGAGASVCPPPPARPLAHRLARIDHRSFFESRSCPSEGHERPRKKEAGSAGPARPPTRADPRRTLTTPARNLAG